MNEADREELRKAFQECADRIGKVEAQVVALSKATHQTVAVLSNPDLSEQHHLAERFFLKMCGDSLQETLEQIEDQEDGLAARISELLDQSSPPDDEHSR